jgi:tetratricopeptide (TPR) repeat protein
MASQQNARKTTGLRQADESDSSDQPTRSSLERLLERTTRFIGYTAVISLAALVILLLVMVVSKIAADMRNQPILIDPLGVPKAMEDQGYTGLVAADRVAHEIRRIGQATKVNVPTALAIDNFDLASTETLPDIEIPETKLSLASATALVENFLHVAPRHVSADLIFASGANWHDAASPASMECVLISIRMVGRESRWPEVMVRNPDDAVTRVAHDVLEMADPYELAVYAAEVEHDFKTAPRLMQEAAELNPSNPFVYIGWGVVLDEKQDYDGAIAKYQQALALDPKFAGAYNNWGNALYAKQDYDGAIAKYQQATELDSKYAAAYYNWGNALYAKQDYDEAIAKYQQATELDSKYAAAYYNWGLALAHKQDYDGAIAKYQAALTLDPKNEMFRDDLEAADAAKKKIK